MLDPQGTVVNVRVPLFNDVYTFYSFLQGGMTDSNGVGNYTVPVMQGLMGDFYHVGLFIDPQTSAYLGSTPVVHTSVVP